MEEKHLYRVSVGVNRYIVAESEEAAQQVLWDEIDEAGANDYFKETLDIKEIEEAEELKE
jgi:hypothetical protein